jgi:hypothetical protein
VVKDQHFMVSELGKCRGKVVRTREVQTRSGNDLGFGVGSRKVVDHEMIWEDLKSEGHVAQDKIWRK